jgi:hypothetical protein
MPRTGPTCAGNPAAAAARQRKNQCRQIVGKFRELSYWFSMGKTILLHIGLPKTGTSLIQGAFMRAPEALARFEIRYLQAGTEVFDDFGHHVLVMAALGERGRRIDPGKPPETIAAAWAAAMAEIETCPEPRIFISSELFAFDVTDPADIARLRTDLSAGGRHRIRIVITLRDIVDLVNSVYAQRVRDGYDGSIEDYLARIRPLLDWQAFVDRWAAVFGPVLLLRFEDLDRRAMADDFLRRVFDLDYEGQLFGNQTANRSLPHSAVAFLREVNGSDMAPERKVDLRNHLHGFLGAHQTTMQRPDFLSAGDKSELRLNCRWPALTSRAADDPN